MFMGMDKEISEFMGTYHEAIIKGNVSILPYYKWYSKLESVVNKKKQEYPRIIKLPKDNAFLLRGDFEPSRIIRIDEPLINAQGKEIWYNTTISELFLRPGAVNGDLRYPSEVRVGNEPPVHVLMGGGTGGGKSVCVNNILLTAMEEYAPWELNLYMSDSKNAEFPAYMLAEHTSHIKSIVCSKDVDYVIDVLDQLIKEMDTRNTYFAKVTGEGLTGGVRNLKDFRKYTGLCVPRILAVFDEFQVLIQDSGRRKQQVEAKIERLARLGRNAGVHLFFASQSMKDTLSKDVLDLFDMRMCVKASPDISTNLLGNDGASKIPRGKCISRGMGEEINTVYRVPFPGAEVVSDKLGDLSRVAKIVNYPPNMDIYSDNELDTLDEFREKVQNIPFKPDRIWLGRPTRMTEEPFEVINFSNKYNENLAVVSKDFTMLNRIISALACNYSANTNMEHLVIYSDDMYIKEVDFKTRFGDKLRYIEQAVTVKECPFEELRFKILIKRMMIDIDDLVFNKGVESTDPRSKEAFKSLVDKGVFPNSEVMYKRYLAMIILPDIKPIYKNLDLSESELIETLSIFFQDRSPRNNKVTCQSFVPQTFWILGGHLMNGFGKDVDRKWGPLLETIISEAPLVNARVILTSSDLSEMKPYIKSCRYRIFKNVNDQDLMKMNAENPKINLPQLANLVDSIQSDSQYKFKMCLFDDMDAFA